jgi:hypothetical protein
MRKAGCKKRHCAAWAASPDFHPGAAFVLSLQLCKEGSSCRRSVCFFAHSVAQLREPTMQLKTGALLLLLLLLLLPLCPNLRCSLAPIHLLTCCSAHGLDLSHFSSSTVCGHCLLRLNPLSSAGFCRGCRACVPSRAAAVG